MSPGARLNHLLELRSLGSWTLGSTILKEGYTPPLSSPDHAYKDPEHHKLLSQSPKEPVLVADITSACGHTHTKKRAEKFKMETPETIRTSLQQGEWVTSIVFKDAYFHIPIQEESRKYLKFHVQGRTYQFKALPFGLSRAPMELTVVTRR